ncbi:MULTISPECIES: hypothetical protein [unclassified Bartonella]|uniref:hypothetical protein n=1 Tax=unclassified Bartonella TaxID=2645622 RepID=UPI0009C2E2D0|nr:MULTISPECIES: hypothetical protein [unclassified Bartonella]AQX27871.1 Endonuclease YncB, thermonuclease family [Bartonella sp. JB15]AQX27903.1 Endonuclease YncB, thermonuclease family [Bartonella sp. JB15]AQX29151.1 Endonuclease YncB, thermonuclease family [Bartonella sp. JB63]AQX29183.1 Endonuclease YncB, thermonuclease family [Bartonella sp. JB63]
MRFKPIIIVYIVCSLALWIISQNQNTTNLNIFETLKMKENQDIINMYLEENKLLEADIQKKVKENKQNLNWINSDPNNHNVVFNGIASVTSGVTFKLITSAEKPQHQPIIRNIHLYGVDTCAPRQKAELNNQEWPCGAVTTAWLVTKTLGQNISCKQAIIEKKIHYAQCFVQGVDLAEIGLEEGMLIISKDNQYPIPTTYLSAEKNAQNNKIGLWSSNFIDPIQWKKNYGSYNPFDNYNVEMNPLNFKTQNYNNKYNYK